MAEAEGSIKDTLEALQSAKKLVSDLEYRLEQLSLGDYNVLREIAKLLHNSECTDDHTDGCSWFYEERAAEMWFSDKHQHWIETARYRVHASEVTSAEYLAALKMTEMAKKRARR